MKQICQEIDTKYNDMTNDLNTLEECLKILFPAIHSREFSMRSFTQQPPENLIIPSLNDIDNNSYNNDNNDNNGNKEIEDETNVNSNKFNITNFEESYDEIGDYETKEDHRSDSPPPSIGKLINYFISIPIHIHIYFK